MILDMVYCLTGIYYRDFNQEFKPKKEKEKKKGTATAEESLTKKVFPSKKLLGECPNSSLFQTAKPGPRIPLFSEAICFYTREESTREYKGNSSDIRKAPARTSAGAYCFRMADR
jgi:hypothetical protein